MLHSLAQRSVANAQFSSPESHIMKMKLALATSLLALCAVAPLAARQMQSPAAPAAGAPTAAAHYGSRGFDKTGMDKSVKPGDDWFDFVNGTWAKNTTIRPDRTSEGAFINLRDLSEVRVHKLLDSYRIDDAAHPDRMKAAIFYQGYMDEPAIEKLDAAPLKARLAPIQAAPSKEDMARIMGRTVGGFGASI